MRIGILLAGLLAVSMVGFSQKQLVGFKMGPGFTDAGGDLFKDTQNRIGLNIGFTYDYSLSDNLSLGSEILYSSRGFRDDFFAGSAQGDAKVTEFNYDYIAVPIKISYSGKSRFYFFNSVGLVPAFLISAKTKVPAIGGSEARTVDVKDRVPAVNFAGLLEVGAGYALNDRYRVFTSFSGQISFFKFSSDEYFDDEIMRHYGFTFAAGIKYTIGK